ncbi:M15 family metallopeptidase [Kribbella sp. NPDC051620]|uniref:M15 family metallopeptidase n=1 Tax=Kribbella sp. NPDC051620 TaxID=3364120 RepID=UPI003794320D
MSAIKPAPAAGRRTRLTVRVAFVLANAALAAVFVQQAVAPTLLSSASSSDARHRALGEQNGYVPEGVTVFDAGVPAVANLDPSLLGALRRAATAARDDGVEFVVNSGWRSAAYQEELLSEAVAEYGSKEEAARWVATPDKSPHVSGHAIDLGRDAAAWLSKRGGAFGLCQIYANESWHYELRPDAVIHGCPAPYADPTQDPGGQE